MDGPEFAFDNYVIRGKCDPNTEMFISDKYGPLDIKAD